MFINKIVTGHFSTVFPQLELTQSLTKSRVVPKGDQNDLSRKKSVFVFTYTYFNW